MFCGDEPKIGIVSAARRAVCGFPHTAAILPHPWLWAFVRLKQISATAIFAAAALPVCRLLLHINGLRRRNAFAAAFSIGRMVDCQRALHRRLRKNIAINSSERLAETLVMQAFLPEQRR